MSDIDRGLAKVRQRGVNQFDEKNPTTTHHEGYAGDNDYKLSKVQIESPSGGKVDIQGILIGCSIYEDLFSNTMSCSVSYQDTNNIARHLPIIGQREKLIIEFKIPGEKQMLEYKFDIYKVSTKQISTVGKKTAVTLKGVSSEQFNNVHTRISKSFYGTIDEMVSAIYKDFVKDDKELKTVTKTNSEKRKFIIPNWHPFDAINWLSARASEEEKSDACNFLFYQDRDGYHFTTLNTLLDVPEPKQQYFYFPRRFRENPGGFRDPGYETMNIQRLTIEEPGDRLEENMRGMYGSKILTHDIVRKHYEFKEFSLKKKFDGVAHTEKEYPIAKELDEFSNKPDTFFNFMPIHKNLNQENELHGGDTIEQNEKYAEWHLNRESLLRQIGSTIVTVTTSGDSRRKCGDVVHLTVTPLQPSSKKDINLDKYLSGKYIVTSIKHNLGEDGYVMDMELSKDGNQDKYPKKSTFVKDVQENIEIEST